LTNGGEVRDSTVTVTEGPSLDLALASLYGSQTSGPSLNNTLNMERAGVTVTGLGSFQNYNFALPAAMTAGGVMLTVTDGDGLSGPANISNSVIGVGILGGSSALNPGDQVTLISSSQGLNADGINTRAEALAGLGVIYEFDLSSDGTHLYAEVVSEEVSEELEALSEGRAGGLAFLNQGADLLVGLGLESLHLGITPFKPGFSTFGTAVFGSSRYHTGSRVDVDGFTLMTGLAWNHPSESGHLVLGAFFEGGWGSYDSLNSFNNAPSVHGDGDTSYLGGGIIGRYDFAESGPGHLYLDASVRAGQTKTDLTSRDILTNAGTPVHYDSSSPYYGAHAGAGYVFNLTGRTSLDLSARYIWTRQGSDSVTIAGDRVRFEAADSHRWRIGTRLAYQANEYIKPYAGAYYYHEFDGKISASLNGLPIRSPELKGGTGIGEVGLTVRPSPDIPLSIDLGAQGYTGKREGVTGSLQIKYHF
jgi:hypothetical protein